MVKKSDDVMLKDPLSVADGEALYSSCNIIQNITGIKRVPRILNYAIIYLTLLEATQRE